MKFNNTPNKYIISNDGTEHWISRSVAVAVCVLAVHENTPYVLINQRGPGLPDNVGLWNLVCGYLDYDESVQEAAVREVWEECGVNILNLMENNDTVFFDPPWDVQSIPGITKQNVTTHHGLVVEVDELPPVSNAHNEPDETSDIRWLPLTQIAELDFAFNHHNRIRQFVKYVANKTKYDFTDHLPL